MGKEIGAYNKYLCKKIEEKSTTRMDTSSELIIRRKDFKRMLGWYDIPSYIRSKVIEEMRVAGLIKIKDKQNIILVRQEKDDSWFE